MYSRKFCLQRTFCFESKIKSEMKLNSKHLFEPSQPTFQRRINDVENERKSDVGFSTLRNVDTISVSDVEATLKQH